MAAEAFAKTSPSRSTVVGLEVPQCFAKHQSKFLLNLVPLGTVYLFRRARIALVVGYTVPGIPELVATG